MSLAPRWFSLSIAAFVAVALSSLPSPALVQPAPADIPTSRLPGKANRYDTLAALLDADAAKTAIVLFDVRRDTLDTTTRLQRQLSTYAFLQHAQRKGAKVLVVASAAQQNATVVPGGSRLPPMIQQAIQAGKQIGNVGVAAARESPVLRQKNSSGRTVFEQYLQGFDHLVVIGGGTDFDAIVPTFEAAWAGYNVYRNPLLDVAREDPDYEAGRMSAYLTTLGDMVFRAERLALPGQFPDDPFVHYVPIGQITGVWNEWVPKPNQPLFSFREDGTPIQHVLGDPDAPSRHYAGSVGAFDQYDLHVVLTGADNPEIALDAKWDHARNPTRTAYVALKEADINTFGARTDTLTDADAIKAEFNKLPIKTNQGGIPLADTSRFSAYDTGLAEVSIEAHGSRRPGEGYQVGNMTPAQLGTVIAEHPDVGLHARGPTQRKTIAHLRMAACGVRCTANYVVNSGPGLADDETAYARQLVRWLANRRIDVQRVSMSNTTLVTNERGVDNPITSWFRVLDSKGRTKFLARETKLLATTLAYDRATDTFTEDPDHVAAERLRASIGDPLNANPGQLATPLAEGNEVWATATTTPAKLHIGSTQRTASGATIDVTPAHDVAALLDKPRRLSPQEGWALAFHRDNGTGKPVGDVMVSAADVMALAMLMRPQGGHTVIVDTDPQRLAGVTKAMRHADDQRTALEWIVALRADDLDKGASAMDAWFRALAGTLPPGAKVYEQAAVTDAYERLQQRVRSGHYRVIGADLATRDGAAVVNAEVGVGLVRAMWVRSDEAMLAEGARLDVRTTKTAYLAQYHDSLALIAGPETRVLQEMAGDVPRMFDSEQAVRDHYGLRGAQALATVAAPATPPAAVVVANHAQQVLAAAAAAIGGATQDGVQTAIDAVHEATRERSAPLARAWGKVQAKLDATADWARAKIIEMLAWFGIVHPDVAQTPIDAIAAHAVDPVMQRIEGEQLARRYAAATRRELHQEGLAPGDWIPVLASARGPRGGVACGTSGPCEGDHVTYPMDVVHEGTGETRRITVDDAVFAQTREFIERVQAEATGRAALPAEEGARSHTMNTAFALMGLLHVLERQRQPNEPDGLPENLTRSLQVQMYINAAQLGVGVVDDAAQLTRLVREAMDVARQVEGAVAVDASLIVRMAALSNRVLGPAALLFSGAMIGVDAYNVANAQTDAQRAVFGAQLGTDVAFATLMVGSFIAEAAGATTASIVMGGVTIPLTGIGIGIVALVQTFTEIANDVDNVAAKFDKYGDLYPRPTWFSGETAFGASGTLDRTHFQLKDGVLAPVHGIAVDQLDLAFKRDLIRDDQGPWFGYVSRTAESHVLPFNWEQMTGTGGGGFNGDLQTMTGCCRPLPDPNGELVRITERARISPLAKVPVTDSTKAHTLVLPATPRSLFSNYEYEILPGVNIKHWVGHWQHQSGYPGWAVLRKIESNDRYHGPFAFDITFMTFEMAIRTIKETPQPTPVLVRLDEHVRTVAFPVFAIPKDKGWTDQQAREYRAASSERTRNMSYTIQPHNGQEAAVTLQLANDYGQIRLDPGYDPASTSVWVLDARALRNPRDVSISVAPRAGDSMKREYGVVSIDGLTIRITGAAGTTKAAWESDAEAWIVLPHGTWRVDFAKRSIVSVDMLALQDVGPFKSVKDALLLRGFDFRDDLFAEISTAVGAAPVTINGASVNRYFASVKDDSLVYAINDKVYGNPLLVFGDAREALFHDVAKGVLHRVRRGDIDPSDSYQLGFTRSDGTPLKHTIERVVRVDGGTLLLVASFPLSTPDWLRKAADASKVVAAQEERLHVAFKLTRDEFKITGLSGHKYLSAWLEGVFHARAGTVEGLNAIVPAIIGGLPKAVGLPNRLTPVAATLDDLVSVQGKIRVGQFDRASVAWVRTRDARVFNPAWIAPATTCRSHTVRRNPTTGAKEPATNCPLAWPNDLVLLGTFDATAENDAAIRTRWGRFWSASERAVYEVRGFDQSEDDNYALQTWLRGLGDMDTEQVNDVAMASDAAGLSWEYAHPLPVLARVSETFVTAGGKPFWERVATQSRNADPQGAGPVVQVDGLQDRDGNAMDARYVPSVGAWALTSSDATWLGATASAAYVRIGDALHEVPLVPTAAMANAFDGRKLRLPLSSRVLDDGKSGTSIKSATIRRDATCEGLDVTYGNGNRSCLSPRTATKTLLAWNSCADTPVDEALKGVDRDYVEVVCDSTGKPVNNGWLAPAGGWIAPPADARLTKPDTRLLGFNAAKKEAYFFAPSSQLLCATDWTGKLKRCIWMIDAQRTGDALFVQQPSPGLAAGALPLVDGVETLGLGTDGERTVRYRIAADERAHYRRIIVDMGGKPLGDWQARTLELAFAGASDLHVQRWPGGWRAVDVKRGRVLELRGSGGHKAIVFQDTNRKLDLGDVPPMAFTTLPETYVEPNASVAFTDRHDVDGDGIADLIAVGRDGDYWQSTHWRTDVAYRNADNTIREWRTWLPDERRARSLTDYDKRVEAGFWTVDGTVYHCGATRMLSHVLCWRMDRGEPVFIAEHSDDGSVAMPKPGDDLTAWVEPLVRRVPPNIAGVQDADGQRYQRFNGRTMECLADPNGTCRPTNIPLSYQRPVTMRDTLCTATSPPAWCTKGLAQQDPRHVEGPWRMLGTTPSSGWVRINEGEIECPSYDGRNCLWKLGPIANLDTKRLKPLRCGVPHTLQWGGPGYGNPQHWCERARKANAGTGTGTSNNAPTVRNLRIVADGPLRVGAVLRGEYDFVDADGDKEGESRYQWYISDPVTGVPQVITSAKTRTYTLRVGDMGNNRKIWFNIERLRSATGTPRDAATTPIGTSVQGKVLGLTPQATQVRLTNAFRAGGLVYGRFNPWHEPGKSPGMHTVRLYRAPEDNPSQRTLLKTWQTTTGEVLYTARITDAYRVLILEVVPEATSADGQAPVTVASQPSPPIAPAEIAFLQPGNQHLPDGYSTISSTRLIADDVLFRTLKVTLDIKHAHWGDVEATLVTPWGASFPLLRPTTGTGSNYFGVIDVPIQGLRSMKGSWTLQSSDRKHQNIGYVDSWTITFK